MTGVGDHDIQDVYDNILYHLKVVWRADNTWDLYINRVKQINNESTWDPQVAGINKCIIRYMTRVNDSVYFDAWGVPGEGDYSEGDNLTMELGGKSGTIIELNAKSGTIIEINQKGGSIQ